MSDRRLLVVDDEADFAEFVRKVGLDLGYDVKVRTDGREFMAAHDTFDPHTIVLDIIMPEVDWIELVHWLVNRGSTARLVLVTGYSSRYAAQAKTLAQGGGISSVLTLNKPVKLEELRAALSENPDSGGAEA